MKTKFDETTTKSNNEVKELLVIVFINEYGHLVDEKISKFKITLSGSCSWCFVGKCWRYEIKDIFPKIPLSYILSDVILVK